MTSSTSATNTSSIISNTSAPVAQSSTTELSQEAVAGRSFTKDKRSSSDNIPAHSKTVSSDSSLPTSPSFNGGPVSQGKNAVTAAGFDHIRKASVTISATGNPNMAGKTALGNGLPVFGSMNTSIHSPNAGHSNLASSGSLNPNSPNPRITSPQPSPSPIPQPPAASGGRPPSSLPGAPQALSFGGFGPEGQDRHQRPSISSGSLTPSMQPVGLQRQSSQQSNSDMNGTFSNGPHRGNYRGGRGGYQGMVHQPYSPNPNYRQPNTPRTAGPNSQFPQNNRALSYSGQNMQGRPSPSLNYAQPVTPGQMGMTSPGMQGQPPYYQQNMGQQVSSHNFSSSNKQQRRHQQQQQHEKKAKSVTASASTLSSLAQNFVPRSQAQIQAAAQTMSFGSMAMPMPTNLAPESGQFEQFLTARLQAQWFYNPSIGQYIMSEQYNPHGMPPQMQQQMQMGYPGGYPASPRPQAMTPQQGQFMPGQYGQQQPQSMSRTSSAVGERSVSNAGQPSATPLSPPITNAPANQSAPAVKPSPFIVPKKTGGIKIVNPNTREELKIEKVPESPANIAPSKSPATISANPTPPISRTPDSHTRTDSMSTTKGNAIAEKFKAEIAAKIAKDNEAEKVKQQVEIPTAKDDQVSEVEEAKVVEPQPTKVEEAKPIEVIKPVEPTPTIVEPEETDSPKGEKELTEEDDEYWERLEQQEREEEERREKAYQAKKKQKLEEDAAKQAERDAKLNEELKRAEAEAEALDEERQKKREQGAEGDDKDLFASLKKNPNAFKATESAPESSGVQTPVSDSSSSMAPPTRITSTVKSKPAALKLETTKQVEAPTPSAALQSLRSARFLSRIDDHTYPAAIASPNPALNSAAPMGKFRYDKNFLMQFQSVFTEKPSETWSEKIKETVGDADTPQTAKGSRMHSQTMSGPRPSATPRQSIMNTPFSMGQFGNARGTTSKERYEASTRQMSNKPYAMQGGFPGVFPGGSSMQRNPSSTSMGGHPQSPRNNPSRGGRGGSRAGTNPKMDAKANANMPLTAGKDVGTLQISETGWKPRSIGQGANAGPPPGGDTGYLAPDVVQRKVKSNLNKMTPTTFDKISGQIIDIVMQSKQESDGRTLRQIIQLTFEKATDEAHWAEMYAQFCARMLSSMTPEIKDETLGLDKNGNVISGNTLFRRYLLNRCQQDFEAGWKSKLPEKPEGESGEAAMLSDEYYAAAAAKRRGLGLVKFIGELYKLGMLTSRIMVMCVQRLLDYDGTPDEAEIESLSSLLQTIGEGLDNDEKGHSAMGLFFERIQSMLKIESLPSRMKFMLLDLIDLKKANWKARGTAQKGPATIEEIHAQAAAVERQKEAERVLDQQRSRGGAGGGRMPMGRGDARFPGQMAPPPQSNSVGMDDLRRLGRSGSRQASGPSGPVSFGPTSMFNTRGSNTSARKSFGILGRAGDESGTSSRTATPPAQKKEEKDNKGSTNAFSALAALDGNDSADTPASPPSTAASPALSNSQLPNIQRSKSPLKDDESGN